jgi:hypothetical protein
VPDEFRLFSAFPNPFNASTVFRFETPVDAHVTVSVFDLRGRRVALLAEGAFHAGVHSAAWNAAEAPTGVYVCRMEASGPRGTITRAAKVLCVK